MRSVAGLEVLTGLVAIYLALAQPFNTLTGALTGSNFVLLTAAAVVAAWAVWTRRSWAPILVIPLAAVVGVPSFGVIATFIRGLSGSPSPGVVLSFAISGTAITAQGICLAWALIVVSKRESQGPTA